MIYYMNERTSSNMQSQNQWRQKNELKNLTQRQKNLDILFARARALQYICVFVAAVRSVWLFSEHNLYTIHTIIQNTTTLTRSLTYRNRNSALTCMYSNTQTKGGGRTWCYVYARKPHQQPLQKYHQNPYMNRHHYPPAPSKQTLTTMKPHYTLLTPLNYTHSNVIDMHSYMYVYECT